MKFKTLSESKDFNPNISPIDVLKKVHVVKHILEIFILM